MKISESRWFEPSEIMPFLMIMSGFVAAVGLFIVGFYILSEQYHKHQLELLDRGAAEVKVIPAETRRE